MITFLQILVDKSYANGIDAVSGTLPGNGTIDNIFTTVTNVFNSSVPLLYSIAILATVIAGVEMIVSQNDDATARAVRTFTGSIIGIVFLALTQVVYNAIWGTSNIISNPGATATGLSTEILGVVNYFSMAVGVVAILMIIVSGIRAIANWGNDDGIADIRRTVLSILLGIIVITVRGAIADSLAVTYQPNIIISTFIGYLQQFLSFLAAIAVLIIVYAGILMILNFGKEDQYQQAKDIILRVFIGFIIIVSSKAILNAIFGAF